MPSYRFVETLTEDQVSDLMDLYSNEFWCHHRQREDVVRMLQATSLIVGLVDEDDRLIGFTRVLTDFVYRATLFDVMIKPTHRKLGLGAKLLDAVVHHPKLQTIENFDLFCLPEMIPFYERWGFSANMGAMVPMRRK